jgi:hypothetical protein
MERSKGSRLKGWIESPNALRWRLDRYWGYAVIETESSKISGGLLRIVHDTLHSLRRVSARRHLEMVDLM